jgi:translation initiation factor IF-2
LAKNLKLNIKNAQLAEALKLNAPKKKAPAGKKAKEVSAEKPIETSSAEKSAVELKKEETPRATPEAIKPEPKAAEAPAKVPEVKAAEVKQPETKAPETKPVDSKPAATSFSAPKVEGREEKKAEEPPVRRMLPGFVKRTPDSRYPRRDSTPVQRPQQSRPAGTDRPPYNRPASTTSSMGSSYPVGPNYPVKRTGPPPASRPPFKRENSTDYRPSTVRKPPIPSKEPSTKEIPQQQQVHKKSTGPGNDFNRKSALAKDANPAKRTFNKSFDSRDRQGLRSNDDERWRKRRPVKSKQQLAEEVIRPKELSVRTPITIKDLAQEMKLKASQLVAKLFMQGVIVTLNDYLDDETTIQLLGQEFECEITIDTTEEERIRITDKTIREEIAETDQNDLISRPPVVTFMGHVDHGKTSLIDSIRKANIAASEAGAITQHIGAFKCHTSIGELTILDTPGHEAFSAMRERGADVTDIVVLVVAGDEGIKPQTIEAIQQAQKANVPLIVALNKCDKPGFDAENAYRQLADQNLLPEAWGGSIITVNCSAKTGEGIKDLLEMLALQSEVLELKANPKSRARGNVIESEMHKGLGAVATLLVQNGTLNIGDAIVFDQFYARVKTMHDEHGVEQAHAGPSSPVKITGLSGFPEAGSEFIVVKSEKEAKDISDKRKEGQKMKVLHQKKNASLENLLQDRADSAAKKNVNLILKADVQGSLEALKTSLRKLPSNKVELNFVSEGVGEVSESDIQFAATSKATILGFHTKVESHAESLIKRNKVTIHLHDIIYHAVDEVKKIMLDSLDKIAQENERGEASVKTVFKSSQLGSIAGCQVSTGTIKRNYNARLVRDGEVIWKGPIASLKRVKEDVKEVQKGYECGILLLGFSDFKEGDTIQAYEITYLQQEL